MAGIGLAALAAARCGPAPLSPPSSPPPPAPPPLPSAPPAPPRPPAVDGDCAAPDHAAAAAANAGSLRTLPITAFGRAERGWEIYAPLIAHEVGTDCAPDSSGFAAALAAWQARRGDQGVGVVTEPLLLAMKADWQAARPITAVRAQGICPDPPPEAALETGRPGEGYGGKVVQLRKGAFEAYRAMVAAARAEAPAIAADPRNLTIFSAYRSPAYDAARCERDRNCDGTVRAVCSPHRTGLALDLYVGQAPGFGPDSTADPNRLAQTRGPAYRWLVRNAGRFGFVNYPFEPWHWEWTGEAP